MVASSALWRRFRAESQPWFPNLSARKEKIVGAIDWVLMIRMLAMLLLALEMGAGFGTASAELISTSTNAMEIELRVEIRQSAETVVAHLAFPDEPSLALPLVQRGAGVFGIRTEVKMVNYQVLFELLGDENATSEQHSLSELGLEFPAAGGIVTATTLEEGLTEGTRRWGWLGLGLGAAALSALAFWVLGARDDEDQESSDTDSVGADGT